MRARPREKPWLFEIKRKADRRRQAAAASRVWKAKAKAKRLEEDMEPEPGKSWDGLALPMLRDELPVACLPSNEPDRRLWCRRSSLCVSHAAQQNWAAFSCSSCPVVDEITPWERLYQGISMRLPVDIAIE